MKKSTPGPLQGHVAIVTGGCSGIGLSTAELYVQSGACVVVVDIRQDRVESAVKRLKELAGGQSVVLGLCADVTDETAMCKVVDSAVQYFGGVDILVSNAGVVVQSSRYGFLCSKCFGEVDEHQFLLINGSRLLSFVCNFSLVHSTHTYTQHRHDDCTEYRRFLTMSRKHP